jgi:DNA-binding NarL/FixJ family response regulator
MQAVVEDVVSVLVVDDQVVVAEGVTSLVRNSGVEVVGSARDCNEATQAACELQPDVILLDVRLGSEMVQTLHEVAPLSNILIFTAYPSHPGVSDALARGATGYLPKDASGVDLVQAIVASARGTDILWPTSSGLSAARPGQRGGASLSPREFQILLRVAVGHTNREIASDMHLAPTTIKTYWQSALGKLRARNRAEAITNAYAMGLL